MKTDLQETIRKRVGGSLSNVPVFQRLEILRANARILRADATWQPPKDDGTLVRKTIGLAR